MAKYINRLNECEFMTNAKRWFLSLTEKCASARNVYPTKEIIHE